MKALAHSPQKDQLSRFVMGKNLKAPRIGATVGRAGPTNDRSCALLERLTSQIAIIMKCPQRILRDCQSKRDMCMTTESLTAISRRRRPRGRYPKTQDGCNCPRYACAKSAYRSSMPVGLEAGTGLTRCEGRLRVEAIGIIRAALRPVLVPLDEPFGAFKSWLLMTVTTGKRTECVLGCCQWRFCIARALRVAKFCERPWTACDEYSSSSST